MRAAYIWGLVPCSVLMAACPALQAGQLPDEPDAPWITLLPIANSFSGILDLNSNPSGAEVTTSLGSGCRTPCSLEVTAEGAFTVTFNHDGYTSTTVQVKIQHARMGLSERKFAPNPVFAELAPVPEPEKPRAAPKKPVAPAQPPQAGPKKPIVATRPPQAGPKKPVAAPQPALAVPSKPVAAAPATQPAPAQSIWPEPVAAAGFIVKGDATVPADASAKKIIAQPVLDEGPDKKKQ